jgi:hypothetical protein
MRKLLVIFAVFEMSAMFHGELSLAIPKDPVRSTFLQFQTSVTRLKETDWNNELKAMQDVGIQTVVLQWLKYDQERFFPLQAERIDPAETILTYADAHGMKVFMGMWFLSDWWKHWDDPAFLKNSAERISDFATLQWERYQHHSSWVGWYIPYEIGDNDFDRFEISGLNSFLKQLSKFAKGLAPTRKFTVANSVFFTQKIPPGAIEKNFTRILSGSGLDYVIIQDGMGEQNWDDNQRKASETYISALARAVRTAGAKPWVAVELFKTEHDSNGKPGKRISGAISEIVPRITRERPLADDLLFFDFFHYMSPFRGEEQKGLYSAYK